MDSQMVSAFRATLRRELLANRLSRFLHVHLLIAFLAGLLPFFTPSAASGTPWWILQALLYCLSLSTLLVGLNSAQAESDEFLILFSQPVPRWTWLLGKSTGIAALVLPAVILLAAPSALAHGLTLPLVAVTAAAAGLSLALAAVGLAIGFWVRDHIRALLATLATWFVLLFGTDILLLAIAGAPWVHAHPAVWVTALMVNPLDALRITVLFGIEGSAASALDAGALASWWISHSGTWLFVLLAAWTMGGFWLGLAGAKRAVD